MDPFTALGVAASAVQFFDFSRVLLKEYQGQRDMARSLTHESFRKATEDLSSCIRRMSRTTTSSSKTNMETSSEEVSLQDILAECQKLAQELLVILYELTPKAQQTKWTSFCQAFKTLKKSEHIDGLREQISYLRGQLVLRVLASLNEKMNASLDKQAQQLDALEKTGQEITGVIAFNHSETREAILSLRNGGARTYVRKRPYRSRQLDNSEISEPNSLLRLQGPVGQEAPQATFGIGTEALRFESTIRRNILRCLHYRHISDRYDTVTMAHQQTFEWVFCDPIESDRSWFDFAEWLEEGSGCYWVRGKAGSGKSTLMKFIHQDEQIALLLRQWAAFGSLTTASFFFWYLGYPIQKSQQGLLRSLLHEVLEKNPELMTHIMPDLYIEATKKPGFDGFESPSLDELLRWFTNLGKFLSSSTSHKMCLFVDGIDEYAGDCSELLKLFTGLSAMTPNLKFVLSGRPISECVDVLGSCPSLRLEDLTCDDIRRYAMDLLQHKAEDMGHGLELEDLIADVVSKSCGVFLWVAVVVRSLLAGLRNGDTLEELQERLNDMPSELSDLYRHMLNGIPQNYRSQASQMLQLLAANFGQRNGAPDGGFFRPFPALQLSFALEDSTKSWGTSGIQPLSAAEAAQRLHQIEARVRSRSLGLVEIKESSYYAPFPESFRQYHVDFIHRTVMEFLKDPEAAATLQSHTDGSSFDPYRALFASSVSIIKCTEIKDRSSQILEDEDVWTVSPWHDVTPTIMLANSSDLYGAPIPATYLNHFESALSEHWQGPATRKMLKKTNPYVADTLETQSTHWFRLLLKESQQSRSVPLVFHHETPFRLWEVKSTLQKAFLAMRNTPMGTAIVDSVLYKKLLQLDADLGFYFVTMICPLPSYLEQQLKSPSDEIGKLQLAGLLDFFVHKDALLKFPLSENRMFTERAARCFELLLEAGADPNKLSYPGPMEYSIWTVFLGTLLFWCEGRISQQHALETANDDCEMAERVIQAFILSGADLTVMFTFGPEVFTPTTAISWILQRQQRMARSDHALEDTLRRALSLMTDRLPSGIPPYSVREKVVSHEEASLSSTAKEEISQCSTVGESHAHRQTMSRSFTSFFRKSIFRSSDKIGIRKWQEAK